MRYTDKHEIPKFQASIKVVFKFGSYFLRTMSLLRNLPQISAHATVIKLESKKICEYWGYVIFWIRPDNPKMQLIK